MNQHTCEALVLMCIDFRFHEKVVLELKKIGINTFDIKTDAGACKHLVSGEKTEVAKWILENIGIAKSLHGIKKVVVINHYDCGAYGGSAAFDSDEAQEAFHRQELLKAKETISHAYPELEIILFFAKLEGRGMSLVAV